MKSLSRRGFLTSAAVVGAGAGLSACANWQTLAPQIIDYIQSAVNTVAKYIPTAESIAALAAQLFGPAWVAAVQVGSAALNQLIAALEAAINALPPAVQGRLRSIMRANPGMPVTIGVVAGVTIVGYR